MFAILSALEQIDVQASMGLLPDVTEYKIDPIKLQDVLPEDGQFAATFQLADLFADGLADPDLLLLDRINSLIAESKQEIETYIAEYHDLYQDDPPAFAEDIREAAELIPDPVDVAVVEAEKLVELPGLETGAVKAMDWSLDMNDKGQFDVDTGLLPRTEIDPRDSTYTSDDPVVQQVLDAVAVVDSTASPIRTGIAEDAYNNAVEGLGNARNN